LITKLFPTAITGGDEGDSEPIIIKYIPMEKKDERKND